jgi:uncharacterized integral membrane protein
MPVQRNNINSPRPSLDGVPRQQSGSRPTDPLNPTRGSRSRLGGAWVAICFGGAVLLLLIVFMLQNTAPVSVSFLGWSGTAPLALTLLIAGVGVGLVALVVGSVRIGQLRHRLGRARRAAGGATAEPVL